MSLFEPCGRCSITRDTSSWRSRFATNCVVINEHIHIYIQIYNIYICRCVDTWKHRKSNTHIDSQHFRTCTAEWVCPASRGVPYAASLPGWALWLSCRGPVWKSYFRFRRFCIWRKTESLQWQLAPRLLFGTFHQGLQARPVLGSLSGRAPQNTLLQYRIQRDTPYLCPRVLYEAFYREN